MFVANNKDSTEMTLKLFWCFKFEHSSHIFVVFLSFDFEQINICWLSLYILAQMKQAVLKRKPFCFLNNIRAKTFIN